jgi:hypothetical protein
VFAHLSVPVTCLVAETFQGKLNACGVCGAFELVITISATHNTEQKRPQYNCLHGTLTQWNLLQQNVQKT